jgi:hypothetical protein
VVGVDAALAAVNSKRRVNASTRREDGGDVPQHLPLTTTPRVSLYYCNLLDALTKEYDVILEETTTFLKHTRMDHGQKRKLRCN